MELAAAADEATAGRLGTLGSPERLWPLVEVRKVCARQYGRLVLFEAINFR